MQRVTVSLDEDETAAFDAIVAEQGYASRSEAIRDLVRRAVDARRLTSTVDGACVANLSYVYDHHLPTLVRRLTELQHAHHDLVVATTHVHLDHDNCLESTMLKGPVAAVRALADGIEATGGVRYTTLNLISAPGSTSSGHKHSHGHACPPQKND